MLEWVPAFWLWQFLGRLHPLIVHFPVSLLVIALLLEALANKRKYDLRPGIQIILGIGAGSAVLAVIFGLLLQAQDDYSGDTLAFHKWSGLATAFLSLIAWSLHRFMFRGNDWSLLKTYRAVLVTTVLGVAVAGHLGANLTHGSDFLTSVLPWNGADDIPRNPDFNLASLREGNEKMTDAQIADLNLEVRSIFAHNCYKCHSAEKIKGELRLDKKDFVFKGGESGPVITPGHPDESEMIRRLLLPRDDDDAMPPKGKSLAPQEIATLQFWIQAGAPWPDNADEKSVYRVAALAPRNPGLPSDKPGLNNAIDRFVDVYFSEKDIEWPEVIDDNLYIRRVYLDIIGLLPSPAKITAFAVDPNPNKRELLVRELLGREEDYAQHWLTFWNDALRNDYTGTGYITGGRFAITEWLYDALRKNKPYDNFVHELISPPDERSAGFIKGIQWRGTVNASQRTEMQAAQNISQVFLGLNLKCASCHDSFISDWKLSDAYGFANIFSDSTLEINRCDKPTGRFAGTRILFEELGEIDSTLTVEGKLKQLADYLTAPANGRLYRTIVNRIWARLMGRGIVHPVDLMDNEPWSQNLLDWLASDFVANNEDLKSLIFTITTSRTYQLPSVEIRNENDIASADYTFRGMHRRRLTAEQFADAVSAIIYPVYSDTLKMYAPVKGLDLKLEHPFMRASLVKNDPFLTALGRPNRENVSTSRPTQANLLQALELTNGDAFNAALDAGAKKWSERFPESDRLIAELYRQALGRQPQAKEIEAATKILGTTPDQADVEDLLWSVMLLPEFQLIF
ncbi:MAG: DUF1549 domain-containing protein [Bacteroidota bacterium]|nr:DUF1549 domain-containing protein [Bacteroidota bacterium]